MRAVYPQFFLMHGQDRIEFLGDWDKLEAVNESSSLPIEILEQNPDIMTWDKILR
jgi:hypothetical protein